MPDEHYVVKDLPLYKEARVADAKARQNRLSKREKKRKEGTLRQAPGRSRPTSSSTTHPSSKKKSVSRPTEKALDLTPSSSSHSSPSTEFGPGQDSTGLPSLESHSNQELEPIVPCINLKPEEEKEAQMAHNLRVGFKERQRKRVSEALPTTPPPAKKSRPEAHCKKPVLAIPMVQVPLSNVVKPCQELVVRPHLVDTCPAGNKVHVATPGGNTTKKDIPDNSSS